RPIGFHDVVAEAVLLPAGQPGEKFAERVLEHARHFYEDVWIHRPRRALEGNSPVNAVGHPRLRKKLRGVIQVIQDCAANTVIGGYDFHQLERKLGLVQAPAAPAGGVPADIGALGAAELAGLPLEALTDEQLEQAYHAAHRLDAEELTAHFAKALVARP